MSALSLERFGQLLDAYGGDPARWPEAERGAAEALLLRSAPARALQQQAAALDADLDAFQVPPPDAALRSRILVDAAPRRRGWRIMLADLWRDLGGWRVAGPAFAASLALGAVLPSWLDDAGGDLPDEDLIAAVQLVDDFPELGP